LNIFQFGEGMGAFGASAQVLAHFPRRCPGQSTTDVMAELRGIHSAFIVVFIGHMGL
jgi:hypothetical protein